MKGWKDGWLVGRMELWNIGRMDDWKDGRMDGIYMALKGRETDSEADKKL